MWRKKENDVDKNYITPHKTRAKYRDMIGTIFSISNSGKSCWFSPDCVPIGINVEFYQLSPIYEFQTTRSKEPTP